MLYEGYPQPWRGLLLALTALVFALIIVQFVADPGGWLFLVILALIAVQFALASYARKQL